MDESELMSLIAKGEHEGLDFKRELRLGTRLERGEFAKDVIAIANSASSNKGYLLVGVDNDGSIVGIDGLGEEQIQQITHEYIRPAVTLRCSLIPTQAAGLPTVGVIEIEGRERPYSLRRDTGTWKQDAVLVRHGSVTMPATPEEIIRMRHESQQRSDQSNRLLGTRGLLVVTLISQLGLLFNNGLPMVFRLVGETALLKSPLGPLLRPLAEQMHEGALCLMCWFCGSVAGIPYSLFWGLPVAAFGLVVSSRGTGRGSRTNMILSLLVGLLGLILLLMLFVYRAIIRDR